MRAVKPTRSISPPNISKNRSRGHCTWSSRWCYLTRHRSILQTESITSFSNES
nr:MAG TPA: hypothetical protein [Caudoviricetes sp.]